MKKRTYTCIDCDPAKEHELPPYINTVTARGKTRLRCDEHKKLHLNRLNREAYERSQKKKKLFTPKEINH